MKSNVHAIQRFIGISTGKRKTMIIGEAKNIANISSFISLFFTRKKDHKKHKKDISNCILYL